MTNSENKIYALYQKLLEKHGDPERIWPQWCAEEKDKKLREIVALGAILTQRTSWRNAHLALLNLKRENLLCLEKIAGLESLEKLRELVRPAGFYKVKPERLHRLACFMVEEYGGLENLRDKRIEKTRKELLSLKGVGPETADVILLYCLDKPSFVIDEYTRRMVKREDLSENLNYGFLQELFEKNLPQEVTVYQNFHALIIIDRKGEQESKMEVV